MTGHRVTLTIENLAPGGNTETYRSETSTPYALPLVFRVVNAAIGAHADELGILTAASKVFTDMIAACAPPTREGGV